jgi:hypothetical protein
MFGDQFITLNQLPHKGMRKIGGKLMYISINKKLLFLSLIFVLPLTIFASTALNIMVFGNSGNIYFVPATTFSSSNGYVNYTDILGRKYQFSSKYLMLIYSSNSKKLLNEATNSIFGNNGKVEIEFSKSMAPCINGSVPSST